MLEMKSQWALMLSNMKKILYISILFLIVFCASCNKDLGNYDYVDVDSLKIGNIHLLDTLKIGLGQPVNFIPEFENKLNQIDEADLEYEWVAFDNSIVSGPEKKRVLCKTRNFEVIPALVVGTYPCYLKVRNKKTGSIWIYDFTLKISGKFEKYGWFVLSDKNSQSHLDYFQDDPTNWNTYPVEYRDFNVLLKNEIDGSTLDLAGKPVSLANFHNQDVITRAAKNYLYINTENKTYKINVTDGMLYNTTKYSFTNETSAGKPNSANKLFGFSSGQSIAIKDNNIYSMYYIYQKSYNIPINTNPDGTGYRISEYIAAPMGNVYSNTLIYDIDNRRFMTFNYASQYATPLSSEGQALDVRNTNMDMVWMQHTLAFNGQAIAVMKNATNYFLVRMTFGEDASFAVNSVTDITTTFPGIASASCFAVDHLYGYVFYAANNKIYQYDMDAKVLKVAKEYTGREITLLKFQTFTSNLKPGNTGFDRNKVRLEPVAYSLIVGSHEQSNPTSSGRVDFLRVNGLMGTLTESFNPFEGMGKVVDVVYTDNM